MVLDTFAAVMRPEAEEMTGGLSATSPRGSGSEVCAFRYASGDIANKSYRRCRQWRVFRDKKRAFMRVTCQVGSFVRMNDISTGPRELPAHLNGMLQDATTVCGDNVNCMAIFDGCKPDCGMTDSITGGLQERVVSSCWKC